MGTPVSSNVAVDDYVLTSQYNNLRADAIDPMAWSEPSATADFLKSVQAVDLLGGVGEFELWTASNAKAPKNWKMSSVTGFAVARSSEAMSGSYAVSLTNSSGSAQYLFHRLTSVRFLRNRYVTMTAFVKVTGGTWKLEIADSITTGGIASSSNITGGTYAQYSVSALINSSATWVEVRLKHVTGTGTATFDSVNLFLGRAVLSSGADPVVNKLPAGVQRARVVDSNLTAGKTKCILIYSPSRDDTIGDWSDRARYTSWFNDELNIGNNGRREFPDPAIIVGAESVLNIYDAEGELWMSFSRGGTEDTTENAYAPSAASGTSLAALDGKIYVATSYGARIIDFINDEVIKLKTDGGYRYKGTISQRNSGLGFYRAWSLDSNEGLGAATDAKSVAVKKIGETTVVAWGTTGGIYLNHWEESKTYSWQLSSLDTWWSLALSSSGSLYAYVAPNVGVPYQVFVYDDVHLLSGNTVGTQRWYLYGGLGYNPSSWGIPFENVGLGTKNSTNRIIGLIEESSVVNRVVMSTDAGVQVFRDDRSNWAGFRRKYITKDYITEEYPLASPYGQWDVLNLQDRSPWDRDLVWKPSGSPSSVTGVRNNTASFNGTSNYAQEAPEEEFPIASATSDYGFATNSGNVKVAQSFQVSRSFFIFQVVFRLFRTGTPTSFVRLRLCGDSGGSPNLADVKLTFSNPTDAITGIPTASSTQLRFVSNDLVTVNPSTTYWLVLDRVDSSYDASNYYTVGYNGGGGYGSGSMQSYNGTSWFTSSWDIGFELYTQDDVGNVGGSSIESNLTVGAWVYMDSVTGARGIINRWQPDSALLNESSWRLAFDGTNFIFEVQDYNSGVFSRKSSFTPVIGQWYHVVGETFGDGYVTKDIVLYVNGRRSNGTLTGTMANFEGVDMLEGPPVRIGADYTGVSVGSATNYFSGRIADPFVAAGNSNPNGVLAPKDIAEMYEIGRAAIASGGQSYVHKLVGTSDAVKTGAVSGNFVVAGTSNGSDGGGVSVIDLRSDTRSYAYEAQASTNASESDRLGDTWYGTDADDIQFLDAKHGILAVATDAFLWIDQLSPSSLFSPKPVPMSMEMWGVGSFLTDGSGTYATVQRERRTPWYIQSGSTVVTTAAGGVGYLFFPNAFPTILLCVVGSSGDTASGNDLIVGFTSYTNEDANFKVYNSSGTAYVGSFRLNWIAIGC